MRTLARQALVWAAIVALSACVTTPSGPRRHLTPELCLDAGFHCAESTECCSGLCAGDDPDTARCL